MFFRRWGHQPRGTVPVRPPCLDDIWAQVACNTLSILFLPSPPLFPHYPGLEAVGRPTILCFRVRRGVPLDLLSRRLVPFIRPCSALICLVLVPAASSARGRNIKHDALYESGCPALHRDTDKDYALGSKGFVTACPYQGSLGGILWGDQEEQEAQVGKRANAESQDVLRR